MPSGTKPDDFEKGSHFGAIRQASLRLSMRGEGIAGEIACQRVGAGGEAQPLQKRALVGGTISAGRHRGPQQRVKGHMCGQIAVSGMRKRVNLLVAADGLKAWLAPLCRAVIDDERGTALIGNAASDLGTDGLARRAEFHDITRPGCGKSVRERGDLAHRMAPEHEPVFGGAHAPFVPARLAALEGADGQRVEELVGHQKEWAGRQIDNLIDELWVMPASVFRWTARRAGEVSTRQSCRLAWNPGTARVARRMSAISVPRPGPSSASTAPAARPGPSRPAPG